MAVTSRTVGADARKLIRALGYRVPNLRNYSETPAGWASYCADVGLRHFTGRELAGGRRDVLERLLGRDYDFPQRDWWPRLIAVACVVDRLREWCGQPLYVAWAYRRPEVDAAVKGAGSDHVEALAIDVDYKTVGVARECESWLVAFRRAYPWAYLSLGFDALRTHVGLFRPNEDGSARSWVYKRRKADLGRVLLEAEKRRHISVLVPERLEDD